MLEEKRVQENNTFRDGNHSREAQREGQRELVCERLRYGANRPEVTVRLNGVVLVRVRLFCLCLQKMTCQTKSPGKVMPIQRLCIDQFHAVYGVWQACGETVGATGQVIQH